VITGDTAACILIVGGVAIIVYVLSLPASQYLREHSDEIAREAEDFVDECERYVDELFRRWRKPSPLGDPVVPFIPQPSPTSTPEPEKPIVLDLGPGQNLLGEILPLVGYYNERATVVAIDKDTLALQTLADSAGISSSDLVLIEGDYQSPSILSEHGLFCANAVYALWPDSSGERKIPAAIQNLVCSGARVLVVSELDFRRDRIADALLGTVDLQSLDTTTSCIQNPILASCADYYGALGMNIGFTSSFSGRGSDAYVVVGTKK
jgi:hypothetical protein